MSPYQHFSLRSNKILFKRCVTFIAILYIAATATINSAYGQSINSEQTDPFITATDTVVAQSQSKNYGQSAQTPTDFTYWSVSAYVDLGPCRNNLGGHWVAQRQEACADIGTHNSVSCNEIVRRTSPEQCGGGNFTRVESVTVRSQIK